MSHKLNKDVLHNGKSYLKGSKIKSSDEGFKAIVDGGHADPLDVEEKAEAPAEVVESQDSAPSKKKTK